MPEDRKDGVNADINSTRAGSDNRNLLVEVEVDRRGLATPVVWVGDKQYRF
jgi:hypothetical protein